MKFTTSLPELRISQVKPGFRNASSSQRAELNLPWAAGTHYEWQKGKEDEIKKRLEGDDGGARSGGILSGLSKNARRFAGVEVEEQQTKSAAEKVLDEIAEQDSALAHRFEAFHKAYLEKLTEDPKVGALKEFSYCCVV